MAKKRLPYTKKKVTRGSPPIISLGTTKLNILKQLAKGNISPYRIAKELHFTRANIIKHLRNLRDKYKFTYKKDNDICSVWEITNKGKEYLGGNFFLAMSELEGVTYLQDRPHNIKIKFPIIEKPKDLIWLEGWKKNDKMKNNIFYHQSFGDIQTTYTGKSMIFQLPILRFKDSELAMAEAGRVAFALARKYQNEVPGLKLGKEELTCQVITQHHACMNDPYAIFCFKHGISYRDELIDIDASEKYPEIEFTSGEESHIHHKRYVDNIKDLLLYKAPTNREINEKIKKIFTLLEEQQKANTDTALGLNSIAKLMQKTMQLGFGSLNQGKLSENTLKQGLDINYGDYIR